MDQASCIVGVTNAPARYRLNGMMKKSIAMRDAYHTGVRGSRVITDARLVVP